LNLSSEKLVSKFAGKSDLYRYNEDEEGEEEYVEEEYVEEEDTREYQGAGKYSKEEVLWALGMVHSRSFSVPTPSGRARTLVPFCDLFNHR
jgi:hypothetical protein